jgi:hypothetical protein
MSPQCHMPSSMCHFNFQSVNSCVIFFLYKSHSHTTYQNLNCVCQLTCSVFGCKFLRVKCQKLCQKYTLLMMVIEFIMQELIELL